jgi:S-adenosylmethionine-diacylgycerolhomoserine-N-methlytransferase
LLAKGGEIHLVDFSDQRGLPSWFSKLLLAWLRKFHVEPRTGLHKFMTELAGETGGELEQHQLFRGYSQYYRLRMPDV